MTETTTRRPALLVVEDEAPMADLLRESLSDEYEVVVAANGKDALQALGARQFDLILSDLMMPGKVQGLDFLEVAMNRQPQAKRILISGYLNPQLMERSMAMAQLSRVLFKPVEIAALRKELRDVLASQPA